MTLNELVVDMIRATPGINKTALHHEAVERRGVCPYEALDKALASGKRAGSIEYRKAVRGWFLTEKATP